MRELQQIWQCVSALKTIDGVVESGLFKVFCRTSNNANEVSVLVHMHK